MQKTSLTWWKRTIGRDLVIGLLVSVLTLTLITTFFALRISQQALERGLQTQAADTARQIALFMGSPLWELDNAALQQIGMTLTQSNNLGLLRLSDADGNSRFETQKADAGELILESSPVSYNNRNVGQVEIGLQRSRIQSIQSAVLNSSRAVSAVAVLGIILFTGLFTWRFVNRPLAQLARGLEHITGGEYKFAIQEVPQEDLNLIIRQVNELSQQLGARDEELKQLINELEMRVTERTRALELSTQVGRRLATILELDQLVNEVVIQLQRAFNYYHVHIYLGDATQERMVLAGGTGEAGRLLLQSGHNLVRGHGVVWRAVESKAPVLVEDTTLEPDWVPNILLPDTRSEAAVPILSGDEVLGVLDVQQNRVEGLGKSDIELLQSIASQVAVALRNAQVYRRIQLQAERETRLARLGERIQRAGTIEEVLKAAISELGSAIGASRTSVKIELHDHPHPHVPEPEHDR